MSMSVQLLEDISISLAATHTEGLSGNSIHWQNSVYSLPDKYSRCRKLIGDSLNDW